MQIRTRFLALGAAIGALAAIALPGIASAEPVVALSTANTPRNELAFFDTANPSQVTKRTITGLGTGEFPQAVDVRPATGGLYLVTTENTAGPDTGRLYSVNIATGSATLIGAPFATTITDGASLSADFNPVVDRLRVVSSAGDSFRVDPTTGLATVDTTITPGTTNLADIAYDRSVAGSTATTLYAIDGGTDTLETIGGVNGTPSPNGGVTTPVGALGIDIGANGGLDISSASNIAYLVTPQTNDLRTVNLATGATTSIAGIEYGYDDLAVLAPSTIALATNAQNAEETAGKVDVTVVRTGSTQLPGSIDYATADGTAKAGSDYTAVSGTIRFAVGEATKVISIPVVNDGTGDPKETFTVTLTNPVGASLGTAVSTITTIETTVADKEAPGLVIADLGIKAYKFFYPNGMKTTYSCSEACTSIYTIRIGSSYIARGTGAVTKPGASVAIAPTTLLGKSRLKTAMSKSRTGTVKALFAVQVTDVNGNKRTLSRYFFIVR
jgi:hypothetical protein